MEHQAKSIRPFIGAKDFNLSRSFYRDLGFEENILSPTLSVFKTGQLAFYLQNAYQMLVIIGMNYWLWTLPVNTQM
eukprot:gene8376-8464_t